MTTYLIKDVSFFIMEYFIMLVIPMHIALSKTSKHDVTLKELHERLAVLATHIHEDNMYGTEFPILMRLIQISSIKALLTDIEQCMEDFK